MTHINKAIATAIADNAVSMSDARKECLKAKANLKKVANEARIEALGGKKNEKELLAISEEYKALRDKAEKIQSGIAVRGFSNFISFSGEKYFIANGMKLGVIHLRNEGEPYPVCPNDVIRVTGAIADKLLAAHSDLQTKLKAVDDLRAEVVATCLAARTIKRLLELWPEAKELLPEAAEVKRAGLPAVRTSELNAAIGLPSKQGKTKKSEVA